MKAAVLHEVNKPLVIEDVTINKPAAREVLIRTAYAGLCHSDLHFIEGSTRIRSPSCWATRSPGIVEAGRLRGRLRQEGRPRHHLPLRVLRHLRQLH